MKIDYLQYFEIYFIIINLLGFALMKIDKERAKRHAWRIPEKTLFLVAILYGSIGISLGMKKFRHKTKHQSFVIGIPVIEILQILLIVAVIWGYHRYF